MVGLSLGWWASDRQTDAKRRETVERASRLWVTLKRAKELDDRNTKQMEFFWLHGHESSDAGIPLVDWRVLDEPPVEP